MKKQFFYILVLFAGLSACKKDLKKHSCKAKTDAEAHECLEKVENHEAKDDGFTHACYEAHEAFEKTAGKEEKNEQHSGAPVH